MRNALTICLLLISTTCRAGLPADERMDVLRQLSWSWVPGWFDVPNSPSIWSAEWWQAIDGVHLELHEAGTDMKWQAALPDELVLSKTPWILVRYRSNGLAPGREEFFSLISNGGETETIVRPEDLISDGRWRTVLLRTNLTDANAVAVCFKSPGEKAEVCISRLEFLDAPRSVVQVLKTSKAANGSFRRIDIAPIFNSGSEHLVNDLGLDGWFSETKVAVSGVPFSVGNESKCVASISPGEHSDIKIPLPQVTSSEVFLLIAASSDSGFEFDPIVEPHQFRVEVLYQDGTSEDHVPARIPSGMGLIPGLAVYSVPTSASKILKELHLCANVQDVMVNLVGVTTGTNTNICEFPRPSCPVQPRPYSLENAGQIAHSGWSVDVAPDGEEVALRDEATSLKLQLSPGVSYELRANGPAPRVAVDGSLWNVHMSDRELKSTDFAGTATASNNGDVLVALADRQGLQITGLLRLRPTDTGGIDMDLRLDSADAQTMRVSFPTLLNIRHTESKELSYCFPRLGEVFGNGNIDLASSYAQSMPVQFMDTYSTDGGLYMITKDVNTVRRDFALSKESNVVSMRINYPERQVNSSHVFQSVTTSIGYHNGDWHAAFETYRNWVRTWYKPYAPRKPWFQKAFNLRVASVGMRDHTKQYFDLKTKKWSLTEGIAEDSKLLGGVDYLHVYDWGTEDLRVLTLGDYDSWDERGGVESFRKAVKQVQDSGTPVGLYFEGFLVDPKSKAAQRPEAPNWWMRTPGGGARISFNVFNACSGSKGWQDYLGSTCARVKRQTDGVGYYLDQLGYDLNCYSNSHNHDVPGYSTRLSVDLAKAVREHIGPEVALYSEGTSSDVYTQYVDGAFLNRWPSGYNSNPSWINIYHFAVPDFKVFEIVPTYVVGNDLTQLTRVFFNGHGIYLNSRLDDGWHYSPASLEFIRKMHGIMHEYADCFTSTSPIPLVPTGQEMLFANQFPGNKRTLWTLNNANYSSVGGELLAVKHVPGAIYQDIWNNRKLEPRISDGVAYLNIRVRPRGPGCIVQTLL